MLCLSLFNSFSLSFSDFFLTLVNEGLVLVVKYALASRFNIYYKQLVVLL